EQKARLASQQARQKAALREDDHDLQQWLDEQGYDGVQSIARSVQAPDEWQTAVEAVLGEWLAGFAVEQLPQVPAARWPQAQLTLVAANARYSYDSMASIAGLPCLASRIDAPGPSWHRHNAYLWPM